MGKKVEGELNEGDMEDENMLMMQEVEVKADEKDDDVQHMNVHSQFKREMGATLSPNALRLLTLHILEHRMNYVNKLQQSAMTMGGETQMGANGQEQAMNAPQGGNIQGPRIGGQSAGTAY